MSIDKDEITKELQEQDDERARRRLREAQYSDAPPETPAKHSAERDTAVQYSGEDKVPIDAGDGTVLEFYPRRPIHKIPRWLAKRLIEQSPNLWSYAEEVPEYVDDEELRAYDIDTTQGQSELRALFFNDPVAAYSRVTAAYEAKIGRLEAEVTRLTAQVTDLQEKLAATDGMPHAPSSADVELTVETIIAPYLDPNTLDAAMKEHKLNGGQQGSLRQALTEYSQYGTPETAATLAERIERFGLPVGPAADLDVPDDDDLAAG